jgi:hypothetical protein
MFGCLGSEMIGLDETKRDHIFIYSRIEEATKMLCSAGSGLSFVLQANYDLDFHFGFTGHFSAIWTFQSYSFDMRIYQLVCLNF